MMTIRICLDDSCDCTTRRDHCTQPEHLPSMNGYKLYPVMSRVELEESIERLKSLAWPGLDEVVARRQAKIKQLLAIQNGED